LSRGSHRPPAIGEAHYCSGSPTLLIFAPISARIGNDSKYMAKVSERALYLVTALAIPLMVLGFTIGVARHMRTPPDLVAAGRSDPATVVGVLRLRLTPESMPHVEIEPAPEAEAAAQPDAEAAAQPDAEAAAQPEAEAAAQPEAEAAAQPEAEAAAQPEAEAEGEPEAGPPPTAGRGASSPALPARWEQLPPRRAALALPVPKPRLATAIPARRFKPPRRVVTLTPRPAPPPTAPDLRDPEVSSSGPESRP
jgi:hypothetical protein